MRNAAAVLAETIARHIRPRPPLTVSAWADSHRILSAKQSAEPGRWRTSRNWLLREPMDAMSARSRAKEVVMVWPIQAGKTECAVNVLGYCMDHHPGPVMVCLPAEVSMNKWIAQKLNPLIEETPAVSRALTSTASRDSSNQRTFKDFTGGQLYIEHAGSPARLKSSSVRTLIVDELDEFAANLGSGDDPLAMLEGRTSAFPTTRKTLYISTPTIAGLSRIHRLYTERSDQRTFHVECPHCRFKQNLVWNGLQWADDLSEAWYECRGCEGRIEEYQKTRLIEDADRRARASEPGIGWVPAKPGARARGYQANALYYPLGLGPRWLDLVRMWKEVQGDAAALKTFINDRLAEPWEDPAMRQVKHELIADRVLPYRLRTAPAGVLAVTAGVDTQDNRLAVHIIGWGRKRRAWTLDYVELMGDPAAEDVWIALAELLSRPIEHAHGCAVTVEAVAIDAGGHRTEAVKNFVRSRRVRRAMAIFGAKSNNAQVLSKGTLQDVNWRGQLDKRGVMIHHVGTVAVKHMLYGLLSTDAEKPVDERVVNFSEDLPLDYFKGMVSETYNPAKNRFDKRPGARNEPLDTWVYAFAATHHPELRLHRFTESDWAAREARLLKLANPNATPAQEPEHAAESPTPAQQLHTGRPGTRRGRGGFVNRY